MEDAIFPTRKINILNLTRCYLKKCSRCFKYSTNQYRCISLTYVTYIMSRRHKSQSGNRAKNDAKRTDERRRA